MVRRIPSKRPASAGILMFRRAANGLELLLVHPGGPFWAKRDAGAWSIPKGFCLEGEDELSAAQREFHEETGASVEGAELIELGAFKQPSGKVIAAWAVEGEFDPRRLVSNRFAMEWPPRSGRQREFPEVDRAAWFTPDVALEKILPGQRPIVTRLLNHLGAT